MYGLLLVMYLALGIVQTFAVFMGLTHWLGLNGLMALVLAPLAAYTPVVGTVAAVFGAMQGWGLDWFQAATLFVGPFVLIVVIYIGVRTAHAADGAQRRDAPKA